MVPSIPHTDLSRLYNYNLLTKTLTNSFITTIVSILHNDDNNALMNMREKETKITKKNAFSTMYYITHKSTYSEMLKNWKRKLSSSITFLVMHLSKPSLNSFHFNSLLLSRSNIRKSRPSPSK